MYADGIPRTPSPRRDQGFEEIKKL
jgi:hypothetical protein